jgi:ATP-dependent DNA helicase RecG
MPKLDLREIALRESEQVEWKEGVADIDDVVRTISAFANDWSNLGGGYVVCGAKETRDEAGFPKVELIGLTSSRFKEIEGRVLERCRSRVEPSLAPMLVEVETDNPERRVLVFVAPASRRAHQFRSDNDSGKFFVRIGRETREARDGILRELLVRKGAALPFDAEPNPVASAQDIDLITLRELLTRASLWDPARDIDDYFDELKPVHALMPSIGVREALSGVLRPRNFALLLFGKDVTRFVPGAHAVISIYPGEDRGEPYAERQEITGPLASQIGRVLELVNAQSSTVFDKTDLGTPNVARFPERALKEAIVNAFAHRDYSAHQPIRVTVFSDRIEVTSPGALLPGIDRSAFLAGKGRPVWRNQALSLLLNRLNLAQAEGQGIPTILRSMREAGNPDPVFELADDCVTCILPAHPRHALLKRIKSVEEALVLGKVSEARNDIEELLSNDPYNVRTVDLFINVARMQSDENLVANFVMKQMDVIASFPRTSLVLLAEGLVHSDNPSRRNKDLATKLLALAGQAIVDEADARRTAIAMRKAGEIESVVSFVDRQLELHPGWKSPALLKLRGRALIDMAKKALETARNPDITPQLRGNARLQVSRYLDRAGVDLEEAKAHADGDELDWVERDLQFLERMRETARQSARRRRGGRGRRGRGGGGGGPSSKPKE